MDTQNALDVLPKESVEDEELFDKEHMTIQPKMSESNEVKTHSNEVCSYDWVTKKWNTLFHLENIIDLREVSCVHLEPNVPMKEFDFDRMDWLMQWALW